MAMLQAQDGILQVVGTLDQDHIPALLEELSRSVSERNVTIDLSRTEQANSILLAILIDLQRQAKKQGHVVTVINWPQSLLNLITLYSLQALFSIEPAAIEPS
ncbi:MAG: STAS domain-containing protein [Neisseriales bacterium]|nr:MAG: STAS domain-containing protein [Neisseriales bacterium]